MLWDKARHIFPWENSWSVSKMPRIIRAAMEKQTYGHRWEGREGELYGESNMETYITICKLDGQWEFAV